jgi:hypothetical protein
MSEATKASISGGVVGGIVLVATVALLCFFMVRTRKHKRNPFKSKEPARARDDEDQVMSNPMEKAQQSGTPAAASARNLGSARSLGSARNLPHVPTTDGGNNDGPTTNDDDADDADAAEGLDSLSPLPPSSSSRPSSLREDVVALADDAPITLSKRHLVAIINELDDLRGAPRGSDVESGEPVDGTTNPLRRAQAAHDDGDEEVEAEEKAPSLWSRIVSFFTPRPKPTVLFRRTAADADERARNGSFRDNPLRGALIAPHRAASLRNLPVDIVPHRSLRYLHELSPARAAYDSGGEHVDLSSSPSIRRLSTGGSGVAPTRLAGINTFLHAASMRFAHAPSSAPKRRVIVPRIEDDDGGGGGGGGGGDPFAGSNPMANLRSGPRGMGAASPSLTADGWEDAGASLRLGMRSSRNVMAMERGGRGSNLQFSDAMANGAADRLDGAFRGAANPMGVRQSAAQTAAARAAERDAMLHFSVDNNAGSGAGSGLGQRTALTRGASVRQHVSGKVAAAIKRVGAALTSSPHGSEADSYMSDGAASRLGAAPGGSNPLARTPSSAAHHDFAMDDADAARRLNGSLFSAGNPRFTRGSPAAGLSTVSPGFQDFAPSDDGASARLAAFEGANPMASRQSSSQRRLVTEAEWSGAAVAEASAAQRLNGSLNIGANPRFTRGALSTASPAFKDFAPDDNGASSRLAGAFDGANPMARYSSPRQAVAEAEWPGAAAAEARLGGLQSTTTYLNPLTTASRAASPRAAPANDDVAWPGEEDAATRLGAALGGTNAMARR